MGKLYLFLFCAVFFASCSKKYKIEGNTSLSRLDGKMLYIKVPSNGEWVKIDSAEVVHGLFEMEGNVDSVVLASLYMDDDCIMPLVIEKGNINVKIDNAGVTVKGSPLNNRFNDFIIQKNALDDRAYEVEHMESQMIMNGDDPALIHSEIEKRRAELSEEMNKLAKEFIQENYENVLGAGVFVMIGNGLPYPILTPVMEEIVNEAPESFKNNELIKEYLSVARSNMDKLRSARY
jgi:hypothetical protein